jgi:hypothetical protein
MLPIFVVYVFIFLNLILNNLGFEQGFLQLPFFSCLVIFFLSDLRYKVRDSIISLHVSIIFIAVVYVLSQQFLSKGFVLFQGGFNIILCTYFFYAWLSTRSNFIVQRKLLLYLMKFLMVFLLIEFSILILGYQPMLKSFFPGYKLYNPFDAQAFLGLSDLSGPNSIFLGSQIAGTISLVASLIFFYLFKNKVKNSIFWFLLSTFLFLVNINGTNFLLLIFILVMSLRKSDLWSKVSLLSGLILIIYFSINFGIFDRFIHEDPNSWVMKNTGMSNSQYYLYAFLSPVLFYIKSDITTLLFGLGSEQYTFFGSRLDFESDFGFFVAVILKNGLVWTFIFLYYLFSLFKHPGDSRSNDFKFILKLCILAMFISSVHYAQIFVNLAVTVFLSYLISLYLIHPNFSEGNLNHMRK